MRVVMAFILKVTICDKLVIQWVNVQLTLRTEDRFAFNYRTLLVQIPGLSLIFSISVLCKVRIIFPQ